MGFPLTAFSLDRVYGKLGVSKAPQLLDSLDYPFKILIVIECPFTFASTGLYGKQAVYNVSLLLDNNDNPFKVLILMDYPFNFL